MPDPSKHLSQTVLEQLADDELPRANRADALAHLEVCGRCRAELDAHRALFDAMAALPRFSPSPAFADAVMARVQLAAAPHPVMAWLRRRLPTTHRGWGVLAVVLAAPTVLMGVLIAWLLAHPLVSLRGLAEMAMDWGRGGALALASRAAEIAGRSGVVAWGERAVEGLASVPLPGLLAAVVLLAVAIPLSAWTVVRLLQTPTGASTHAY